MSIVTLHGDCREMLQTLPDRSVQTVVTSPPYYGLRKYSDDPREIGQEATPGAYVAALVEVFRQVKRVLRDDGTAWLNLGDSYAGYWGDKKAREEGRAPASDTNGWTNGFSQNTRPEFHAAFDGTGIKPKDLIGIPWRVAFALQDDGWYLRSDIIWSKPNCMPESVTDRPTRAHEYIFLLSKNARYFYDAAAIAEPIKQSSIDRINQPTFDEQTGGPKDYGATGVNTSRSMRKTLENFKQSAESGTRNRRTVWSIATQPFKGSHYATMPEALIEPCILAGSSAQACEHCGAPWIRIVEKGDTPWEQRKEKGEPTRRGSEAETINAVQRGTSAWNGQKQAAWKAEHPDRDLGFAPSCACPDNTGSAASVVLDPFGGSGTVGRVAARYQRNAVLIELNQAYIDDHIESRTDKVQIEMFV